MVRVLDMGFCNGLGLRAFISVIWALGIRGGFGGQGVTMTMVMFML